MILTKVQFFTIKEKKNVFLTEIEMDSQPALDMGFLHDNKYYKVTDVKSNKDAIPYCIVKKSKKPIKTEEHKSKI